MPRYFFSRMPSEKKYSPGASLVAASREPIMTEHRGRETGFSCLTCIYRIHHQNILVINSCTLTQTPICPICPYLWMLPVPELWQCAQQSGCRHQRLLAHRNAWHTLIPYRQLWPGVCRMPALKWGRRETEVVWMMRGNLFTCGGLSSELLVSSHFMTADYSLFTDLSPVTHNRSSENTNSSPHNALQIHVGNWNKILPFSSSPANYSLSFISQSCFQERWSNALFFFKCWINWNLTHVQMSFGSRNHQLADNLINWHQKLCIETSVLIAMHGGNSQWCYITHSKWADRLGMWLVIVFVEENKKEEVKLVTSADKYHTAHRLHTPPT